MISISMPRIHRARFNLSITASNVCFSQHFKRSVAALEHKFSELCPTE